MIARRLSHPATQAMDFVLWLPLRLRLTLFFFCPVRFRDSYASYIGHTNMMDYISIVENESRERVRMNLLKVCAAILPALHHHAVCLSRGGDEEASWACKGTLFSFLLHLCGVWWWCVRVRVCMPYL